MQPILTTVHYERQTIELSLTRQTALAIQDGVAASKQSTGDKQSLTRQTPRQQRWAHVSPIKPFTAALQPHRTQTGLMRKTEARNKHFGSMPPKNR